ncbi:MAG: spore gernimation protein GerA [Epulopiscium sp. Nuni2H_MBin001]|nr:MAG: spore gernimation protein GerA [Epulopiscium sp. Nuni2H_MBin001]
MHKEKLTSSIDMNLKIFNDILPLGTSFDIAQKVIKVFDRTFYIFFIDGFTKDTNLEFVRRDLFCLGKDTIDKIHDAKELIEIGISAIEVATETDIGKIITALLSGQTIIMFDGSPSAALIDVRTYPTRGVEEPDKEKVLRGAKDGFVETIVFNTALIRRRIRDPHLTFEMFNVGTVSQTDVAIGYMSNKVNPQTLKLIRDKIKTLKVDALTVTAESLIEALQKRSWINPLPRARYTERPDIASAQIMEGKIVIIIDNTPSTLIMPVGIFDFIQDVDDFYLPVLTGNYLRLIRLIVLIMNLVLTPGYVLMVNNIQWLPEWLMFILPADAINVPLFIQFIGLEFAVDALKIASLNTPGSLGTSLSVIGGLVLGEYAVKTGWLIPHTILYMSIVALSSFTQPSVEFSYSIKFGRIVLLILTGFFGVWGMVVGLVIDLLVIATTKTISGTSYLYPLIPFNWRALKSLLFRQPLSSKQTDGKK